ncbi:MAG: arsenate reductase family protein [Bacteroidota bacterium]|jgi:arsenate reductase
MKIIFYLGTCDTCTRILKELNPGADVILQDIKKEKITEEQIDLMRTLAGSYQSVFSKVAKKYKAMGLNEMQLTEKDYRRYILIEYTFLKRPVIIVNDKIFIGNLEKAVSDAKAALA